VVTLRDYAAFQNLGWVGVEESLRRRPSKAPPARFMLDCVLEWEVE
jgi:hypothetical protein